MAQKPLVVINGVMQQLPMTEQLSVGAFTFPAVDGTANQTLATNGSGMLSWVTPSGGGGGLSYLALASNQTTNTSGFELIGSFTLAASAYTTIRFLATAAVTTGSLTGEIVFYNLTDAASVTTLTYTSTTLTQIVSVALSLPPGSKTYEVRQRVLGGSSVSDRIVCAWAGLSLE